MIPSESTVCDFKQLIALVESVLEVWDLEESGRPVPFSDPWYSWSGPGRLCECLAMTA